MKILKETYPYRFVENDNATAGWIEKFNFNTKRYFKMYQCESTLQMATAMEDIDYVKWLDPDGVACYRKNRGDVVKSPY